MSTELGGFVKQAQELQTQMNKMMETLRHEKVRGSAGGGMVIATLNGLQDVVDISIDEEVVVAEDKELLEEMIVAAVNNGRQKAQELKAEKLNSIAGGFMIPDVLNSI